TKRNFCRHSKGAKDAKHEVGRNVLGVSVHDRRDARTRCLSETCDFSVSQSSLFHDLDNLAVERAAHCKLDSVSAVETEHLGELASVSRDNCLHFFSFEHRQGLEVVDNSGGG